MACWDSRRPTLSYVSKLDLTLSREKLNRSQSNLFASTSRDHGFEPVTGIGDMVSSVSSAQKENFGDCFTTRPKGPSGVHCSRLEIMLEQKDRKKNLMKCPTCNCTYSPNRLQMPWRYSSSCRDAKGDQACIGQGGFAPDRGCKYTIPDKQNSVNFLSNSCSSPGDDQIHLEESSHSTSKIQSSWTSRLDVVLANNSPVSVSEIGKPYTIYTSCNSEQSPRDYGDTINQITNINGVKMYISRCNLTVRHSQPVCQGDGNTQSSFLMPRDDNSCREYPVGFQSPQKGFIMSEAPTLQITQFQVTRSPANASTLQQTSTRDIWMSPEKLPRVSGTSGSPEIVPNLVFFQRSSSPSGSRTNLYPVLIPTQHKASKITLVIGSSVAPLPVQVIQECNRSPTPAIFISNGDHPNSPDNLGSGFLLSINPIGCSKQRYMDIQRSSPLPGTQQGKCKSTEPYVCHTPSFTVMPRLPSGREGNAPIAVNIEAFGGRRGAVKISISHSVHPNNFGS